MTTLGILLLAGLFGLPEDPAGLPPGFILGVTGARAPGDPPVAALEPEEPPISEPPNVIPAEDMLEILVHLERAKRGIRKQQEKRLAVLLDRAIAVGWTSFHDAPDARSLDPDIAYGLLKGWVKRDRVIRRLIEAEAWLDEEQAAYMVLFNNQTMFRVEPPLDVASWRDRVSERMKEDQSAERPPPTETKVRKSSDHPRHQSPCKRRRPS